MTARETFESAMGARDRLARLDRVISGEPVEEGGGSALVGHSSGIGNPTASAAIRNVSMVESAIVERDALRAVEAECSALVRGVRAGLGAAQADVLEWYYLDAVEMFYVASELRVSMSTCYRMRDAALEWVDATGAAIVKAMGMRRP